MNFLNMNRRDFVRRTSLLTASGFFFSKYAGACDQKFVVADTVFGKVRGIESRGGIKIFKGIHYGASTAGANRFMPPVDPESWTGVRDALEYGHRAPQSAPPKNDHGTTGTITTTPPKTPYPSIFTALEVPGNKFTGEDEDCLVLNIWTPGLSDSRKRPVMFWLHGGGFSSGAGSNTGWDGTNLCLRGDVVVITINHRLNVMGFANLSAFSPDFASSGDNGMLDIVHALKWVRKNISNFGGDPNCVMIFGQSGGGQKCESLLSMPLAKGLFHRAVIESGISIKTIDKELATKNAEALLDKLSISKENVHDIQKVPLEDIMAAYFAIGRDLGKIEPHNPGFIPSVDGHILPQHPFYPAASTVSPDVPVIIGCTRTEWTGLTTDVSLWHLDEAGLQAEVKKSIGDPSEKIIELYRKINPEATPSELYFLIQSDYTYCVPTIKIAERRAALNRGPVYAYYFAWESPVQDGLLKTPHNMEWPFAFDNTELCAKITGGGPRPLALADKVSDAWIAFARTGDPNTKKLPHWPKFNAKDRPTMVINDESKVINDPLKEQRTAMYGLLKYGD